ncbi:hypothetical protein [Rhizohabitans arisaemae]|uniref:hypothetical protein n=1 Tax=Rhizohabitans arisaemae TaxID=2720610 RepID=UPI0024B21D76|nr:hypothetical protein [Rhizohabitans arisaemae]
MDVDRFEDPQRTRLRERLEAILTQTEKSTSWRAATRPLHGLINRDGFVPIRTRLAREDLIFLAGAREELMGFADLGLRLLDLHQPRDAGGTAGDTAHPILRCRSCMWRWPCPTFRAIAETFVSPQEESETTGWLDAPDDLAG